MKFGNGLKGIRVNSESQDSQDSTAEGTNDGGLSLPDEMPAVQGPVSGPMPSNNLAPAAPDLVLPDEKSNLENVYQQVAKTDPNRAAQVRAIQQKIDEPAAYIEKNLPEIQKAMSAPGSSLFKQIEDQYPGTAKFLSDPKNMAVAHDDLSNLASHEGLIKSAENYFGSLYGAGKYGAEGSVSGLIARQALPDQRLLPKDPDILQRFAMGAGSLAGDYPFMLVGGAGGTLVGASAGAVAGMPGGIPGIGVGIAAGGFAGGASAAFALPAALKTALQQKIQNGEITSYSDIVKEAAKQGFVGLLTAGAGSAAKAAFPASALGAKTVLSTAAPLAAEVGTMTAAGSAVEGKTPTWQDLIDSTLQVGALHSVTHMLEGSVQDKNAQTSKDFYTALGNTAEASKLRERLPEGYQELVHQLTVDGPVENIYIPADAAESYFQSKGIDPTAAMSELGVEKSYAEAKSTGGDVEIPLSTWTSKIAGTEHYQGLADDVKFNPEDMTAREVNQRKAEIQEQVRSLLDERKAKDQAQADADAQTKRQEEVSKVHGIIQEQLKAAGLSRPETEFNPQVHEAFFNTMGKALGVAPEELAQRFPLTIGRMDSPEASQFSDQVREPSAPVDGERIAAQSYKQDVLHAIRSDIEQGSVEKGNLTYDQDGNVTGRHGAVSTFPDYFKNKGYNKKETLSAIDKHLAGKDLTERQSKILDDLYHSSGYDKDLKRKAAEPFLQGPIKEPEEHVYEQAPFLRLVEPPKPSEKFADTLERFIARFGGEKKSKSIEKAIRAAQDENAPSYVKNEKIPGTGFAPNFESKPTGTIGIDGFQEPHGPHPDPLSWYDQKFGATKALIERHAEEKIPLTINTSSDLVGHDDYIEAMPKDTTVRMHLMPRDPEVARALFPGSPSLGRQEAAIAKLKEAGVRVEAIKPTADQIIESAGGIDKVAEKLGVSKEEALQRVGYSAGLRALFQGGVGENDKTTIETPEFKTWFGDSRAVDENGKPKRLYHGSPVDFNAYSYDHALQDGTALGRGFYFTDNPNEAKGYGKNIHDVYVRVENPASTTERTITKAEIKKLLLAAEKRDPDALSNWGDITTDGKAAVLKRALDAYDKTSDNDVDLLNVIGHDIYGSDWESYFRQVKDITGHDGVIQQQENGNTHYVPFLSEQIKSVNNRGTFETDNPNIYEQGAPKLAEASPRGRIRIGGEGYAIDLFKNADRSTFLHETGHYFLDVMGHIANDESAPAQIKDDFKTILNWLGVDKREDIGTDEHEKFARGFERYLMEGNAPSSALTRAFNRFRKWLTSVYQNVKSLNVDLSDDVRGVMDRMLASQEEIERAQQDVGLNSDSIPGLTPELEAKIQDLQSKARDQAESALLKEQMKETTEKHKEFLSSERERLTKEATDEVSELPLYKAMDEASLDIGRDSRSGEGDDTVSTGARAGTIAEKFLAEKLSPDDAGKFEALAEVHGFGSGEELAQHMIMAEEGKIRQREISMRVEAGMAPHADLMKTDAIRGGALKAIHSEKMTELLALEREAMSKLVHDASVKGEVSRRQRIEARVDALAAKEQARELLGQKSVKDATNAGKYVTAERNAAVKVAKALAKKDYEAASEFKRQQMLNHAIASEAMRNKTAADKSISYLSDFAKRGNDLKDMPYGFMRQIDQLLSKSGFKDPRSEDLKTLSQIAKDMASKGEDPAEIANRTGLKQDETGAWTPETLPDFVERVNGNYYPLALPDSVMSGSTREYSDLTMSELKDLRASVKSIADIGKKYDRFLGDFKTMDMKQAASELAASIKEKYGTPFADETKVGFATMSKFQDRIASLKTLGAFFTRWLDTMYTTCHKLDGLEEGPAKDYIFRPFERAADQKSARTAQAMKEVEQIFSDHYDPKELKDYKESRLRVGDHIVSKENILSMALNWGNEGNKSRLLSGIGIAQDQIEKAFSDHLDKNDWDFVQKTWDHIDKYWPEIAKLEMDVNGVEPKKVQAAPFTNQHGSYDGGYYPIAYDYDRSADAFKNAEKRDALYKQFSTAKAATEQGHAESRVKSVERPLRLSLDVLTAHHEDVIHDLEFRKAIIDSSRFLNQKDVKGALVQALGIKGYAGILEWVKAAASDGARQEPLNPWETAAQWLRMKNSVVSMGFKIASAPKIFLENINNVASELGVTDAARAVSSYLTGSDMHEKVISNSEFMKQRANHLDRDMADVMKKVQGEKGPVKWATQHAFFVHAYMDQAFSFPLWNFVFDKAMEEHGEQSKATSQADEAVRRTFMSSGAVIDQPRIMRGAEYQKAMLVAYGYSSMMWNRFSLQAFDAKSQWIQGDRMAATATAAKAFVHTFMVPALVTSLTAALVHNSQSGNEDDEKKKIVADFISDATPLSMIPVTRDLARYGVNKMMGNHTSDLQLLPQEQAIQRLFMPLADTAMAIKDGHMNDKLPEHVANSISFVAGVPKEINDVVFNLLDYTKGQGELTYRDALSRKSKH